MLSDAPSIETRTLSEGDALAKRSSRVAMAVMGAKEGHTSERSTKGGPSAMSSAFVPGCILRDAPWSNVLKSFCCSSVGAIGDLGPSWSSAIGGGLGRRGELDGDAAILGEGPE